jgi:hypothetical protein
MAVQACQPQTSKKDSGALGGGRSPKLIPFCRQLNLPSDLSNALAKCRNAFENLRYYYEEPDKVVYYIGDFAWNVMRAIVEIKPEWTPQDPPPLPWER